ncbi:MAG: tRNA lysidine(34) synthetase TilS, partial [Bacteroidales bacterium]|nr:tRNA lysidine(34) synthetase TilS [Bacteroidales bacterium]
MLSQFLTFINKHQLIAPTDRILLTVSGGVDSMVMLHLFMQTDFQFAIAHCNFQLRGQDSIDDEQFVSHFAQEHNIQLFTHTFDTKNYAKQKGISIEMAARELRYNWFQQLLTEHHYTLIATAHHQNDVLETFFLNMLRTTGLSGLRGIKTRQGNIIRPMLFCGKNEILQYAEKNHLQHKEDITNQDDTILRNYIRLHILPEFEHLNPNAQ